MRLDAAQPPQAGRHAFGLAGRGGAHVCAPPAAEQRKVCLQPPPLVQELMLAHALQERVESGQVGAALALAAQQACGSDAVVASACNGQRRQANRPRASALLSGGPSALN